MGTKLVELRPVKMKFASLLEELESAEAESRSRGFELAVSGR